MRRRSLSSLSSLMTPDTGSLEMITPEASAPGVRRALAIAEHVLSRSDPRELPPAGIEWILLVVADRDGPVEPAGDWTTLVDMDGSVCVRGTGFEMIWAEHTKLVARVEREDCELAQRITRVARPGLITLVCVESGGGPVLVSRCRLVSLTRPAGEA